MQASEGMFSSDDCRFASPTPVPDPCPGDGGWGGCTPPQPASPELLLTPRGHSGCRSDELWGDEAPPAAQAPPPVPLLGSALRAAAVEAEVETPRAAPPTPEPPPSPPPLHVPASPPPPPRRTQRRSASATAVRRQPQPQPQRQQQPRQQQQPRGRRVAEAAAQRLSLSHTARSYEAQRCMLERRHEDELARIKQRHQDDVSSLRAELTRAHAEARRLQERAERPDDALQRSQHTNSVLVARLKEAHGRIDAVEDARRADQQRWAATVEEWRDRLVRGEEAAQEEHRRFADTLKEYEDAAEAARSSSHYRSELEAVAATAERRAEVGAAMVAEAEAARRELIAAWQQLSHCEEALAMSRGETAAARAGRDSERQRADALEGRLRDAASAAAQDRAGYEAALDTYWSDCERRRSAEAAQAVRDLGAAVQRAEAAEQRAEAAEQRAEAAEREREQDRERCRADAHALAEARLCGEELECRLAESRGHADAAQAELAEGAAAHAREVSDLQAAVAAAERAGAAAAHERDVSARAAAALETQLAGAQELLQAVEDKYAAARREVLLVTERAAKYARDRDELQAIADRACMRPAPMSSPCRLAPPVPPPPPPPPPRQPDITALP